jgi:hypothetical protein
MSAESESPARCSLTIQAGLVARLLAIAIACLIAAHVVVHVAHFGFGHDHLMGLNPLFDMNRESNVPTWYSGTVFLATAAALGVVAAVKRREDDRFHRHWTALALAFLYLSCDELTQVHEKWGDLLNAPLASWREREVLGGVLRNLWVLPAGVIAGILGLSYVRFLAHLPPATRTLFVVSGVTFVGAAVGMEMLGAAYSAAGGRYHPGFMVFVTIEEGLEMTSIAVFLYAVLTYAARSIGTVHLEIRA